MIVVVCLDNEEGMLFNHRRQSRDKGLVRNLSELAGDKKIYASPFSKTVFKDFEDKVCFDENFLASAGKDDYCFVENASLIEYADKITGLIIYEWNELYPADTYFDFDYSEMKLISAKMFSGTSHRKITREIYIK